MAASEETAFETIETVSSNGVSMRFCCLGDVALWRARTLFTKEPETIEWIDTFHVDEVLWDVGANVGIYSIYAAAKAGARVVSFEPAAANYFLLNRNIEINRLDDRIKAYALALSDADAATLLYMRSTGFARALSNLGEPVNEKGEPFVPAFRQGAIGYSIDSLVANFGLPFPNHIKIDVDGIENKIIAGAKRALADPRLKSLAVEIEETTPSSAMIITAMQFAGFSLVWKRHAEMYDAGPSQHIFNLLFRRHTKSSAA